MRYAIIFLTSILFAAPVYAQLYGVAGLSNSAVLRITTPEPTQGSVMQVLLSSPVLDLKNSFISWRVNGTLLVEGEGLTEASVPTGSTGQTIDISASIVNADGDVAYASFSFTPATVDILYEADGYVPPFYGGRTLPGIGAQITFVAYPTLIQNGQRISEKDLVYTWRHGEKVLGSSSGKGKFSMTLRDPLLGAETISVQVESTDGELSAYSSLRLPEPTTVLRLYEEHPLFGTLFHNALGASAFTSESEMTFQAIPYFAPSRSMDDGTLTYAWQVNRRDIALDASKPSRITINADGSSGIALIELEVGHASNFFFGENAAWRMTFSSAESSSSTNPFAPQQ